MTRILLAKYNANKENCYDFINSDSNDNDKLYIICDNLEPGEYHIFANVNWPFETKCRYVLSTYSNFGIEIEQLDTNIIPIDYITKILGSFMDKNCKVNAMTANSSFQQSFNDNDTGFYMLYFKNKSENEFLKVNFECTQNQKCLFLTEKLVSEHKIVNSNDGSKIDAFSVQLNPNSKTMLIWRLADNFWHSRVDIKSPSCQPSHNTVVTSSGNYRTVIDQNLKNLTKENLSLDCYYAELESEDGVFLIFENKSTQSIYKIKVMFPELSNLRLVSPINSILSISAGTYEYAFLKKIDSQQDFNFRLNYSLKKN
jgi:hypothetical protein